jgi:hypothetical protein
MFKKEGLKQTDEGGHKQLSMDPDDEDDQDDQDDDEDSLESRVRAQLDSIQRKMVDLLRSDVMAFAKEQFGHDDSHSLIRLDPVPKKIQYISTESQLSIMRTYCH